MHRSRSLEVGTLFAVVLSALSAGCGGAATPQPQTPAVDIAPPPPSSSAEPTAPPPPPKAEAPEKAAPAGNRPSSLPGTSIRFTGGDGSTQEQAIVILGAKGETDGVASEHKYLELVYGPRGRAWKVVQQSLLSHNGKHLDALQIDVGGRTQTLYFDITDYFGKF
jgi:hypothetical protein